MRLMRQTFILLNKAYFLACVGILKGLLDICVALSDFIGNTLPLSPHSSHVVGLQDLTKLLRRARL